MNQMDAQTDSFIGTLVRGMSNLIEHKAYLTSGFIS